MGDVTMIVEIVDNTAEITLSDNHTALVAWREKGWKFVNPCIKGFFTLEEAVERISSIWLGELKIRQSELEALWNKLFEEVHYVEK